MNVPVYGGQPFGGGVPGGVGVGGVGVSGPLFPIVIAFSEPAWLYEYDPDVIEPSFSARAYTPAMIGVAALVPPTPHQPPQPPGAVSYTATGVPGSATAATSLYIRPLQTLVYDEPSNACHDGCAIYWLHQLPESGQTVSLYGPRFKVVPPTDVTYWEGGG